MDSTKMKISGFTFVHNALEGIKMKWIKSLFKSNDDIIPYMKYRVISESGKRLVVEARIGSEACEMFKKHYPDEKIVRVEFENE